jgi:hypothetical protein
MASLADITPSPLPSITLGKKEYKFMPFSVRVKMHMGQVLGDVLEELKREDNKLNFQAYIKVAFFAIADPTGLSYEQFNKQVWDLAEKEAKAALKLKNQQAKSNSLSLQEMYAKPTILDQIMQAVATWLEADAKKIERLVKVKKKYREAIRTTLGLTIWSCSLYWLSTAW